MLSVINPKVSRSQAATWLDHILRRGLDVIASAAGLLLLSPIFAVISILIHLDTPGPVFYHGPRIGKGGKVFGMVKFRTMFERPESYAGARVTCQDDDRITPLGRWLRDSKINELPQLWNVLIGDMSLVGPRPEDPKLTEAWSPEVRAELLSVRPGITSPASVLYRDEEKRLSVDSLMSDYLEVILPSKLRLEQLYIRNRSILSDLDIIFWTAVILLPKLRHLEIPNYLLFAGPLWQFVSRFLSWFTIDFIVALGAAGVAGVIWRTGEVLNLGIGPAFVLALSGAVLFSLINMLLGLNRVTWEKAPANMVFELILSTGLTTVIMFAINYLVKSGPQVPSGLVWLTGLLAMFGFIIVRYRERLVTGMASRWLGARRMVNTLGERVLIVGAGDLGELVSWLLRRGEFSRSFSIVGMVDDDPHKVGLIVADCKVMGVTSDLPHLVEQYDVGLIIFAINEIEPAQRDQILSVCFQTGARLALFPDMVEVLKTSLSANGENPPHLGSDEIELSIQLNQLDGLLAEGDIPAAQAMLNEMKGKIMKRAEAGTLRQ